ncbi:MAG: hypothetical protein KAU21_18220 [Gammaproteobacteria bacterium]|nr:hypothetical protein [Gammaproteobacteria bacterium]
MKTKTTIFLFFLVIGLPTYASAIDLRCEELTKSMVARLSSEELLVTSAGAESRARTISLSMCTEMQDSARKQHEQDKASALKNWIFEYKANKAGNKRLKNIKR